MALPTYIAHTSPVSATTTAVCPLPAGFAAGDLLVMMVGSDSSSIGTPTGFTQVGTTRTGGGTSVAVFKKTATGAETGNTTSNITGGTKGIATMAAYRPPADHTVDVGVFTSGSDSDSTSTAVSITGSSVASATDDMYLGFALVAAPTGTTYTGGMSSNSWLIAGATLGTQTSRAAARTASNTLAYSYYDRPVTTGATGAASYTAVANGANASGSAFFVLIRATPNSVATPAQILDIGTGSTQNHFDIQIARDGDATVTPHTMAEIIAGYEEAPYFDAIQGAFPAVSFYARLDAPKALGATFTRAEMRELNADGTPMKFDALLGTHELRGRCKIMHVPPVKPSVMVVRLHNGDTDRIAIRTELISGVTKLVVRLNGATITPYLSENYAMGTEFEWKIRLVDGTAFVYYNDMVNPVITSTELIETTNPEGWYFKFGLLNQADTTTDLGTEYGQVQFRTLTTAHSDPVIDPPPGGDPPFSGTANAGSDQNVESQANVTLSGSATGSPTIWLWRQISGEPVTLSSTSAQSPTFKAPATVAGSPLVFGLTVRTATTTASAEDMVTVNVRPHIEWRASQALWKPVNTWQV